MDAKHLSERLTAVASYVPANARMADIGSDHAYLPVALALQGKISFAIAGEVVKGPFENASHEIRKEGVTDIVKARIADGLTAIKKDDQIDTVVIAGMGGALIVSILAAGVDKLDGVNTLILQPNVGEQQVRVWLVEHNYQLTAEQIVAEDGHIYEILVAIKVDKPVKYTNRELLFGPFLIKTQGTAFKEKWRIHEDRLENAIQQMSSAKDVPVDKIDQFKAEIALIEEVVK